MDIPYCIAVAKTEGSREWNVKSVLSLRKPYRRGPITAADYCHQCCV